MSPGYSADLIKSGERGKYAACYREETSIEIQENEVYMRTIKFASWQDDGLYIGFLNDYPDYLTQGKTKEELTDNLKDLLFDLESGEVPYIHKVEELLVA